MTDRTLDPRAALLALALAGCVTAAPAPSAHRAGDGLRAAATLDTAPSLGPARPVRTPAAVTRTLPNGLTLAVIQHRELPIADVVLVVRSGAETDAPDRQGTAALSAMMLKEGTTTRSAPQIADQEAHLGVAVSAAAAWDQTTLSLHTPTAQLDSALALFADMALRPAFAEADLERVRKQQHTRLLQLRDRAPAIADRVLAAAVYGDAHPYGRPSAGTDATVGAITRDDVARFHDTYVRPNNATLLVVGDVDPDDVERRVRRLFGAWERRDVPAAALAAPSPLARTTVYLVDKPGAPQASVRFGTLGARRATDDYFALLALNTALGGTFSGRLNQALRERKGYTYGANSRFEYRRAPGPFTAYAEVAAAKTDSALLEFMRELRAIRDTLPQAELDRTRRYLTLDLPNRLETTQQIASMLIPIVVHGLPLDYFGAFAPRVANVSQADVQRAAARYIDPDRMAVVVVGDRRTIEPAIRAAGIGPVEIVDVNGRPLK